jgi:hypothetical protein
MWLARSAVFAALVSLTGCYDGLAPAGAPCNPTIPACPSGQSCVFSSGAYVCVAGDNTGPDAARPDARMIDADPASLDDDSDGVQNGSDNCPSKANPNQSNEDADPFGDICDVCPFAVDNTDGDADGVGDACDPNPGTGGDQIVLFEGFDGPMPTGWQTTGSWTTSSGALISNVAGGNQNYLVTQTAASARQTIYARMTLTAVEGGQAGGALGVVDRYDAGGTTGVMCGGVRGNGGFFGLVNAGNGIAINYGNHPMDIGTTYMLKLTRNDNNYACTDTAVGQTINAQVGPNGSLVGLRNRVMSASYAWILVVKSP